MQQTLDAGHGRARKREKHATIGPSRPVAAGEQAGQGDASARRCLSGTVRAMPNTIVEAPSGAALRAFLHGLPGVDAAGAAYRASYLSSRSLKSASKVRALDLAISMVDLTTLEGMDTAGKVRSLCSRALRPDAVDETTPSVAAVCVYPDMVRVAREAVGRRLHVASVATAFPAGPASLDAKLADVTQALDAGADEIDMVIDRGAFLSGDFQGVFDEILTVKKRCPQAHLKVILETGELGTLDNVRRASWLAMLAGADFIKTSTGKVSPAATMPVTLVMLEAVRDFHVQTGQLVGVKPAGGIRQAKEALRYLVMVNETVGPQWLTPDLFRFGASSLLNDLLLQRRKAVTGCYESPQHIAAEEVVGGE